MLDSVVQVEDKRLVIGTARTPDFYQHFAKPGSNSWYKEVNFRVTDLNFITAFDKRKWNVLTSLMFERKDKALPRILPASARWKFENDFKARKAHSLLYPEVTRTTPGLCVHGIYKWLGCEIGDIISDPSATEGGDGIVMYFIPYSQEVPSELPDKLGLLTQLALQITNKPWAHVMIWAPHTSKICIVEKDDNLWYSEIFPSLSEYYRIHLYPNLIKNGIDPDALYSIDMQYWDAIYPEKSWKDEERREKEESTVKLLAVKSDLPTPDYFREIETGKRIQGLE
jgi:hypothetical protein